VEDIVERLRKMNPPDAHMWGDLREAADEIERLRETVDLLTRANERLAAMSMGLPAR
jgi:hypothetical protein